MTVRNTFNYAAAACALLAAPTAAVAQQAGGAQLEEVVVTARRVEENLQTVPLAIVAVNQERLKDKRIERIVDISLNEVVVRSVLTSATLFAVTLMMNVFGTGLVRNFAFAMNAGIVTGAYSSIFIAPPLFLWVAKKWYGGPAPARSRQAALAGEP